MKVERVYGISLKTKRFQEHIVILATLEKSWVWGAASPLSGWKTWIFLPKSEKHGIERVNFDSFDKYDKKKYAYLEGIN